jgi:hypothetical protein
MVRKKGEGGQGVIFSTWVAVQATMVKDAGDSTSNNCEGCVKWDSGIKKENWA